MSLFGIPFFGAGTFMLLISVRIIPVSNSSDLPWWAWLILAGMGISFTSVGGVLVFGREWITVNNRQMRVWISKGLLIPMRSSYYDLWDFNSVIFSYIAGDSETSDSYPIALASAKGLPDLVLLNASTYGDARKQASLLGEFLRFPVTDHTTDNPIKLHDHKQQNQPQIPSPITPAPAKTGFWLSESDEELIISIQGSNNVVIKTVMGIIPLALFLIFSFRFIGLLFIRSTPWIVRVMFLSFLGIFFILIPMIQMIKQYRRRGTPVQSLKISSLGMELADHAFGKKHKMSWEDIYEVDFSSVESNLQKRPHGSSIPGQFDHERIPGWARKLATFAGSKGLIIKASDGLHFFGKGLSHDELVYLKTVVSAAMIRFRPSA